MANILIIGATSAVASELAERFAKNSNRLFLVGRSQEKLSVLMAKLNASLAGYALLDFNDTEQAETVVRQAVESMGTIDTVLIAHGWLGDQLQSEVDFQHAYDVIHTNYINVVAYLIPLAACLKAQGSGKIAVLSSVAGDRGRPRNFTYGSAKGALALYLQGLRSSLYGSGVEVYCFKLGPVDSPMTVDHDKNFSFSSIEKVAGIIEKGLKNQRYNRYVPGYWFWVMWVVRWLPESVFQKLGFLSAR
ncbi:MAG: SDR family NAD(P)-dependent oxidoreductase [Pseudomonadales bacterium]|nr:SDR family NAD(P)-dependent oxidoreductase [Pseudomonadales bacterium]